MLADYFQEVLNCTETMSNDEIVKALHALHSTSKRNAKIYVIGNGGSAAIATHFCTDLIKSGYARGLPIAAFALADSGALITATSNDFSYDQVFSWQIKQLMNSDDLLFAISSSGNSPNILMALEEATRVGAVTISLTGFDGGAAAKYSNISIVAKSEVGNYGPVEDSHAILCHYLAREIRGF